MTASVFSEGTERDQWHEIGYILLGNYFSYFDHRNIICSSYMTHEFSNAESDCAQNNMIIFDYSYTGLHGYF